MRKNIINLFLLVTFVMSFSACTEEEGTNAGSDGKPMVTVYSYKADAKLYNPENDAFIRVAVNGDVKECFYLTEKTEEREKQFKSLGEAGYIEHVIAKGTKITEFPNLMTADFYVKGLKGQYTISVVAVGSGAKSLADVKFKGYDWVDLGKGTLTSEFFGAKLTRSIQKLKDGDLYQIVSAYADGYNFRFTVKKDNSVTFEKQKTGYVHKKYGMTTFGEQKKGSKKEGKKITLVGDFRVAAGRFGTYTEVVELP